MSRSLDRLIRAGSVSAVPVLLGPRDQRLRRLFWTKDFDQWCRHASLAPPSNRSLATVAEQLNQSFAEFVAGRPLTGMTKCDPPRGEGIWRLKTPDLRLYGWADEPQTMILARGEFKQALLRPGPPNDRLLGRETVAIRRRLSVQDWMIGELYDIFPRATR